MGNDTARVDAPKPEWGFNAGEQPDISKIDPRLLDAYRTTERGTVQILTQSISTNERGEKKIEPGAGSGFIADNNGRVITALHVVKFPFLNVDRFTIRVKTPDGAIHDAVVKDADPVNDLAVLQIMSGRGSLTPLAMGDSSKLKPQANLLALGFPLGTLGLIGSPGSHRMHTTGRGELEDIHKSRGLDANAVRAEVETSIKKLADFHGPDYNNEVQRYYERPVLAAKLNIAPGSSGCPVVDESSGVVGIALSMSNFGNNDAYLAPSSKIVELLQRPEPAYNFRYELQSQGMNLLTNHTFTTGMTGLVLGGGIYKGFLHSPRLTSGAIGIGGIGLGVHDYYRFNDSFLEEDRTKYGIAMGADVGLVAGAACSMLTTNPRVRLAGQILMGAGALTRIGAEFVPTLPKFLGVSRTDTSDIRPPFVPRLKYTMETK
jgi:hypothetical protein